jgi:hypothetical protein
MNSFVMPTLTLSTGLRLPSEHVQQASYYPRGSFRVNTLIHSMSAERYGEPETHEQNFLYIGTINGPVHVRGSYAEQKPRASKAILFQKKVK